MLTLTFPGELANHLWGHSEEILVEAHVTDETAVGFSEAEEGARWEGFKSMSCRLKSVVDSFHSVKASTLGFDLYIFACCAKFFIARDHQVLPKGFSNVELGCAFCAGERFSSRVQKETLGAHIQLQHCVTLRKGTRTQNHGRGGGWSRRALF